AIAPALADVGTLGLFADGAETVVGDRLLDVEVPLPARQLGFQPCRLAPHRHGNGIALPLDAVLDGRHAGTDFELAATDNDRDIFELAHLRSLQPACCYAVYCEGCGTG